jgi:hypothetical protein
MFVDKSLTSEDVRGKGFGQRESPAEAGPPRCVA